MLRRLKTNSARVMIVTVASEVCSDISHDRVCASKVLTAARCMQAGPGCGHSGADACVLLTSAAVLATGSLADEGAAAQLCR